MAHKKISLDTLKIQSFVIEPSPIHGGAKCSPTFAFCVTDIADCLTFTHVINCLNPTCFDC